MKASLLYRLSAVMPTQASFRRTRDHASIFFTIEAQNPWVCNHFFNSAGGVLLGDGGLHTPSGSIRIATTPAMSLCPNVEIYLRNDPGYDNQIAFHAMPTMAGMESYDEYRARIASSIETIHDLLKHWSTDCGRLNLSRNGPIAGYSPAIALPALLHSSRAERFREALAELPEFNESDEGRPLSPHFEPGECISLSLSGAVNNIFWV